MNYINFYEGTCRDERKVSIGDFADYVLDDIIELVDSMITGIAASAPVEGAMAALEDGAIWYDLCEIHGDEAVEDALDELHDLLRDNQ